MANWIRKTTRLAIYMRDNMTCPYCERNYLELSQNKVKLSLDHCLPRSKGGNNKPSNLMTCCIECNIKMSDKLDVNRIFPTKKLNKNLRQLSCEIVAINESEGIKPCLALAWDYCQREN